MSSDVMADQGNLREGLAILQHRVDVLEQRLGAEDRIELSLSSLNTLLPDVQRITQELFPGPFSYSDESDPEFPADTYVVINVESTGDTPDVVRRRCQWHERIRALSADLFGKLRLSITPR